MQENQNDLGWSRDSLDGAIVYNLYDEPHRLPTFAEKRLREAEEQCKRIKTTLVGAGIVWTGLSFLRMGLSL